jgi:hypothetical protein
MAMVIAFCFVFHYPLRPRVGLKEREAGATKSRKKKRRHDDLHKREVAAERRISRTMAFEKGIAAGYYPYFL